MQFANCPICGAEVRVRVDGKLALHSPGRSAIRSGQVAPGVFKALPEDYCPGGSTHYELKSGTIT